MKVKAPREVLTEALGITNSATGGRTSPMPILQDIKLVASKEGLVVTGTDLEVAIRYLVKEAKIEEEGQLCLNSQRLLGMVREDTAESIEISGDEKGAIVEGKNARYRVNVNNPEDFPSLPVFGTEKGISVNAELLQEMIEKTVLAAASEATRYSLNGVLFDFEKGKFELVATDGRRLAKMEGKAKGEIAKRDEDIIVPVKGLVQLQRLLGDEKKEVEIRLDQAGLLAKTQKAELFARLVEGHFPPYQEVIPKEMEMRAQIPREGFLRAIRQAYLMTTEETRAVRLHFLPGMLRISSRSAQAGEAEIELEIGYNGKEIEMAFNPDFLLDFLKVARTDEIVMEMKDKDKPALFRTDGNYVYLVMPVSLD